MWRITSVSVVLRLVIAKRPDSSCPCSKIVGRDVKRFKIAFQHLKIGGSFGMILAVRIFGAVETPLK